MELPFVFDMTQLPELHGAHALLGLHPPPADLARMTHAAWVNFARTGDPGWERYSDRHRATMRIGETWELVEDPHRHERLAWGEGSWHDSDHRYDGRTH